MSGVLRSRENPRVRRWAKLARDARLRRRTGRAMIEGPRLVAAALDRGFVPLAMLVSEPVLEHPAIAALVRRSSRMPAVLAEPVFAAVVDTETPQGIAAEIAIPACTPDLARASGCVFLDAVQDAGNVGAILRSAAAFGVPAAVLGPGCADGWSPKVLRAASGAHFALAIAQSADLAADLAAFGGAIACALPRGGTPLRTAQLPRRIGWLFGAEGRGVREALAARADLRVTIPIRAGSESLNVAAAAAICLYEAAARQ